MDLVKIELIKALILIGAVAGMIVWDTLESRKDSRRIEKLLTEIRDEIRSLNRIVVFDPD